MAESFAHKWGQVIGHMLQASLRDVLQEVANRHGLYVERVKRALLNPPRAEEPPMAHFLAALEASLSRGVQRITVVVLHGQPQYLATAAEAIAYLQSYPDAAGCAASASKYEIHVHYNTGDVIDAIFQRKEDAVQFLEGFAS